MTSNINLEVNRAFKLNKGFYKHYNKKGYIELKCFIKYPELRKLYNKNKNKNNKKIFKSFNKVIISALNNIIKRDYNYKLILNSRAIKYYTLIKK